MDTSIRLNLKQKIGYRKIDSHNSSSEKKTSKLYLFSPSSKRREIKDAQIQCSFGVKAFPPKLPGVTPSYWLFYNEIVKIQSISDIIVLL